MANKNLSLVRAGERFGTTQKARGRADSYNTPATKPQPNGKVDGPFPAPPGKAKGRGKQGREGPRERMLAKLKESDLDAADAKIMGLKPCTEAEAAQLKPALHAGLFGDGFELPYWLPNRKPLVGMYRYRSFETEIRIEHTSGFLRGHVEEKKIPKYLQPDGSDPRVYFSRVGEQDWEKVMANPGLDLYITEGELKAACACKKGYITLGLGGVFSFECSAKSQRLIPDLALFVWNGRNVFIVYDSDTSINRNNAIAEERLARRLADEGAMVKAVRLPTLPGMEKTGFDDFLSRPAGKEEFDKLLRKHDELFPQIAELYQLNTKIIFIEHPPLILFYPNGSHPIDQQRYRMRSVKEVESIMAPRQITKLDKAGDGKPLPAYSEWIKWGGRAGADSICYEPGQPTRYGNQFNMCEGFPYEPKKGDVGPVLQLARTMMSNAEPEHIEWLWQWFAYPIQHPGAKLATAVLMWGSIQGSGKTLLGQTIASIYGKNANTIEYIDLKGPFNEWAQFRQFILGEEITGSDNREHADRLKNLITNPVLQLRMKYLSAVPIRNCMNFYMTSNHPDALYLSNKDRRYFVHEVLPHPLMDTGFFGEYSEWLYIDPIKRVVRPETAAAVYWHLLHDVDLSGFDPNAAAPRTKSLAEMAAVNETQAEELAHKISDAESAEEVFGKTYIGRDLWALDQVIETLISIAAIARTKPPSFGPKALSLALKDVGIFNPHPDSAPWVKLHGVELRKHVWPLFHREKYEGWGRQKLGDEFSRQWGEKKAKYT